MSICHNYEMEKTTIYLNEEIKEHLIDLTAKMSKERRKRVTMTDVIREALKEYLKKKRNKSGREGRSHKRNDLNQRYTRQ